MSIETKKNKENMWEIFTGTGREPSGINLKNWIDQIQENGCGEILITSIDQEGTQNGFDLELLEYLKRLDIEVPVIFSGGCGNLEDIKKIKKSLEDDAIALASVLHYEKLKITDIKKEIYSE